MSLSKTAVIVGVGPGGFTSHEYSLPHVIAHDPLLSFQTRKESNIMMTFRSEIVPVHWNACIFRRRMPKLSGSVQGLVLLRRVCLSDQALGQG